MKKLVFGLFLCGFFACVTKKNSYESLKINPEFQVVAELSVCPGNIAVSSDERIFASIHPMRMQSGIQLIEVTGNDQYVPYPNDLFQSPNSPTDTTFDTPLGVLVDKLNRLWVVDVGLRLGRTRLFAFNIENGELAHKIELPAEVASSSSFIQDVAIDEINHWAYLADFRDPGIVAVDFANLKFKRFSDSLSMYPEDTNIVIQEKVLHLNGRKARVGINPITISEDRSEVFYGPMSGTKWYGISATAIRNGKTDEEIKNTIRVVGTKPLCDGVATGKLGNHYFTNIQNGSIDVLDKNGMLSVLVKDRRMSWPDNVRFAGDNLLYVCVNQLHLSPAFNDGVEKGVKPYFIGKIEID